MSGRSYTDLIATDYELEPLPKKKKTVWIAVSPACTRGAHPTSYAKHTPTEVFSSDAWPVYELEIEVEE